MVFEKFQRRLKKLDSNEVQNNGSNKKLITPTSTYTLPNVVIVVSILFAYVFLRILLDNLLDYMSINVENPYLVVLIFFTIVLIVVKWRRIKK